jgi:hypothetical protein
MNEELREYRMKKVVPLPLSVNGVTFRSHIDVSWPAGAEHRAVFATVCAESHTGNGW